MTTSTLGARLREARKNARLDQNELGEAVGITGAAISAIELGKTEDLSLNRIKALANETGVSPAWLAFGLGSPQGPYRPSEGRVIDSSLLAAIVEIVSTILAHRKKTLPPQKLGLLVARIYEIEAGRDGRSIDENNIQSLLELTL